MPNLARGPARLCLAAGLCLATVASIGGLGGAAVATGGGQPAYPSQQQVDHAKAQVSARRGDVAAIKQQLADAQSRAAAADQAAEIAAEAYNGAMWRLSVAQKAAHKAAAHAVAMRKQVTAERGGIAQLVVQSYQNGTSLNSITAVLGSETPEQMMGRTSVVNMAGQSMQADYDRFTKLSAAAAVAETRAHQAAVARQHLADKARQERAAAESSAQQAESLAGQVAAQRDQLIHALAKAEHVSVALATQRQHALAEIAREKALAEARRRAAAAAAAAAARARAAAAAAAAAKAQRQHDEAQANQPAPVEAAPPAPVFSNPGPGPGHRSVAAAIAFAKAQLGKPYQWGGAGPSTWDCSGLTMMAWNAGGIALPHFAAAQYDMGTPIAISNARPGDLLFWSYNGAPSGIHHVALYLGNGAFIEAPHTGAYVQYDSIYDWYPDFAVRLN